MLFSTLTVRGFRRSTQQSSLYHKYLCINLNVFRPWYVIFRAYLFQKWRKVLYMVLNILLFKALLRPSWVCGPSRDFLVVFCVNDSLFHFSPTRPLAECILGASSITLLFFGYRVSIYYLNFPPFLLMLSVVTCGNLIQGSLFLCNNSYVWAESKNTKIYLMIHFFFYRISMTKTQLTVRNRINFEKPIDAHL